MGDADDKNNPQPPAQGYGNVQRTPINTGRRAAPVQGATQDPEGGEREEETNVQENQEDVDAPGDQGGVNLQEDQEGPEGQDEQEGAGEGQDEQEGAGIFQDQGEPQGQGDQNQPEPGTKQQQQREANRKDAEAWRAYQEQQRRKANVQQNQYQDFYQGYEHLGRGEGNNTGARRKTNKEKGNPKPGKPGNRSAPNGNTKNKAGPTPDKKNNNGSDSQSQRVPTEDTDRSGESREYPHGDNTPTGPEGTEHLFSEQLRSGGQGESRYYDQQDIDQEEKDVSQDVAFKTYTTPLAKHEADFSKSAPTWYLGKQMWYVYMEDFYECGEKFMPRQCVAKSVLYSSIKGEAKQLIAPHMNPKLPKFKSMTIQNYSKQIQAVFEPVADAPRMRLMFLTRKQNRMEHACKYAQHKLYLFLSAYPQEYPPWSVYYEETLNGLQNNTLANEMRRFTPTPINNIPEFKANMERIIQAMQGSVLAGHMKPTELVGVELDVVINPVNHLNTEIPVMRNHTNAVGEGINVIGNGNCFQCNEPGHLRRECPQRRRKTQSIQAINEVQEISGETDPDHSIEALGRRYIPYKIIRKPPTSRMAFKRRKQVAAIEMEDGTKYEDVIQGTDSTEDVEVSETNQINTMNLANPESSGSTEHGNGLRDTYDENTFLGL